MQIHMAQWAKYRLFQEGYSMTPQMHSYNISCLAGIFCFLFFFKTAGHGEAWRASMNPECLWWTVTGKDILFLISSIHLSIFC